MDRMVEAKEALGTKCWPDGDNTTQDLPWATGSIPQQILEPPALTGQINESEQPKKVR